jgi:hypothetical protein
MNLFSTGLRLTRRSGGQLSGRNECGKSSGWRHGTHGVTEPTGAKVIVIWPSAAQERKEAEVNTSASLDLFLNHKRLTYGLDTLKKVFVVVITFVYGDVAPATGKYGPATLVALSRVP